MATKNAVRCTDKFKSKADLMDAWQYTQMI